MEVSALAPQEILRSGPLELRVDDQIASIAGVVLSLTRHELALLTALARREGAVIGREQLAQQAWARPLARGDRSVDVYVRRLRLKLASAAPTWEFIHTHFAFGYRFNAEQVTFADPTIAESRPPLQSESPRAN
jgi:DNA-binding response OmpR family regulator